MRLKTGVWSLVLVTVLSVALWSAPSPDIAVAAVASAQAALSSAVAKASAGLKLEDWESDEEFALRKASKEATGAATEIQAYQAAVLALRAPIYGVEGARVTLKATLADSKAGRYAVSVTSQDPAVPYQGTVSFTPKGSAVKAWSDAVKAGSASARLPFKLYRLNRDFGRVAVTSLELGVGGATFTLLGTLPVNALFDFPWTDRSKAVRGTLFDLVKVEPGRDVKTAFWIPRTPVTQDQYEQITGTNPSQFKDGYDAAQRPVESLNYYTVAEFCNRLSAMDGLAPVYSGDRDHFKSDLKKSGWRLPLPTQYRFAAEGGNKTKHFAFVGSDDFEEVGWYYVEGRETTFPVGLKKPNELGLFDMVGNVYEWLQIDDKEHRGGLYAGGAASGNAVGSGSVLGLTADATGGGITAGFVSLQIGFRPVRP